MLNHILTLHIKDSGMGSYTLVDNNWTNSTNTWNLDLNKQGIKLLFWKKMDHAPETTQELVHIGLFVCAIFIEGFKLLQWLALLSKQALSHTFYKYLGTICYMIFIEIQDK